MLDQRSDTILTQWEDHYSQLFGQHTLCLKHQLDKSPIFSDDALAALLDTVKREDYHVNFGDNGVRREGDFAGLSGAEILKIVRENQIWINLRAPGRTNPAYSDILSQIYHEFESKVPGLHTYNQDMTILISSPNISVKYHMDVPGQSLWQVRGTKKVYLYPNTAPFLPRRAMEKLVTNEAHETDLQYADWFDDHAEIIDLAPGQMIHWPLNGPHRVVNHDCMNVSVTTEHWTNEIRNVYASHYANGMLRKVGFKNLSMPDHGPSLWARLAIAGAIKYSGIKNRTSKPYKIDFCLDPNSPTGLRDIEPFDLRK